MRVLFIALFGLVAFAALADAQLGDRRNWDDYPRCDGPDECGDGQWCNDGRCFCDDGWLECGITLDGERDRDGPAPSLTCVHPELFQDDYCDCPEFCDDEEGPDVDDHDDFDDVDGVGGWEPSPGDGSSSGDPHYRTFDGMYYDFQGVGEHVYCSTPTMRIHSCNAPWVHNPRFTTVNRAVAARVGATTVAVEYQTSSGKFVLYVNGEAMDMGTPYANADLTVSPAGSGVRVTSAAGDVLNLSTSTWSQWINIDFKPASDETRGLCGTANGNLEDDFTGPDGTVMRLHGMPWYYINHAGQYFGSMWTAENDGGSILPSAITCAADPDFATFDLLSQANGGPMPVAATKKPATWEEVLAAKPAGRRTAKASSWKDVGETLAKKFAGKAGRRASPMAVTTDPFEFARRTPEAAACLAAALDISTDELYDRAHEGSTRSVRYYAALYDLLFFGTGSDADMPAISPASVCRNGHLLITAALVPEVVSTPSEGAVAFCDGNDSCQSAQAASRGSRVSITWAPEGSC